MGKRRAYRSCDVKNVVLEKLLESAPTGPITVGLDVGKREIFAVVRWSDDTFERPWKILNPSELTLLVELLKNLAKERPMIAAMESTGTYGDALRQALTDAELDIQRVSGKAASDYAEIFDGVPSKHDGKDAAIVAELTALGKSWPWPYRSKTECDAEMARWVDSPRRRAEHPGDLDRTARSIARAALAGSDATAKPVVGHLAEDVDPLRRSRIACPGLTGCKGACQLGPTPLGRSKDREDTPLGIRDGRCSAKRPGRETSSTICDIGAVRLSRNTNGPPETGGTLAKQRSHPPSGRSGRSGHSLSVVGRIGRSAGLSLRGRLS